MGSYLTGTIGTRYLWFNGRMGAMTSPGRQTDGDYAEPVAHARNITVHPRVGTRRCTKVTKVTIVPEVSFEKRLLGDEEERNVGRLKHIHLFASYGGQAFEGNGQRCTTWGTSNYVNPDCAALTDLPD